MSSPEETPSQCKVTFGGITRGSGKIYQEILACLPEGTHLESLSCSSDGDHIPLPSLVIEQMGRPGSFVLLVAVLSITQTVTIRIVDGNGTAILKAEETLDPALTKLRGQLNTLAKKDVTRIRNCDRQALPGTARLAVCDVINDRDEEDIVWGEVTFDVTKQAERNAPVEVLILGSDGRSVASSPWVCLRDSCDEMREFPSYSQRTIQYSLRIPTSTKSFVVWARSDGTLPDGMVCVEAHWARQLRADWHARTDGAMACPRYDDWFINRHRSVPRSLALQRDVTFPVEPTFSIVVPLYHTPIPFFDEMAASVLHQTYSKLELILVNSTPEDSALATAIADLAKTDDRVKVVDLDHNLGITENTNAGILAATGDFVAFFDHDDILEPDILYNYVIGINEHPDTDLLYCDEDKYRDGTYCEPNLKPDFDWDLLASYNYLCHMLTVRKSVLDELDLPGSEFDGAQDHHMTFRIAEKARNIYHARKVLYHWRIHEGSTASAADAKTWTSDAGLRAVQSHFDRIGVSAKVTPRDFPPNTFKVNYSLTDAPLVSIIIPNKDEVPVLERCIKSVLGTSTYQNIEILIVENNSTDPATFAYYDKAEANDSRIRVLRYQGEFNYSAINNWAVAQSHGTHLILLNNDTKVIAHDWIEQMLGHFLEERVGIVGAKLLFPDDTVQHAGVRMRPGGPSHLFLRYPAKMPGYLAYNLLCRQCSAVTAACLMVSRAAFDDVGGLDEDFRVAFNDVDFCLRVGATGRSVVWEPDALLYHYESVSRGLDYLDKEKLLRLKRESGVLESRWPRGYIGEDPFSSVSFDYDTLYCALAR